MTTNLRQRMTEDMQVRNLSPLTQSSYVQQVSMFARHFDRSPAVLGPEDIRDYQLYLTNQKKLDASSIKVAVSAIRFLYRVTLQRRWDFDEVVPSPKKPRTLPIILSPEEVVHFLGCVANVKQRTILTTCYAAGLRISEAVHLMPSAIDRQRMVIRIDQGKGRKDRYVMLSPKLLEVLIDYWHAVRPRGCLFPGDIPGQPITRGAVELACKAAPWVGRGRKWRMYSAATATPIVSRRRTRSSFAWRSSRYSRCPVLIHCCTKSASMAGLRLRPGYRRSRSITGLLPALAALVATLNPAPAPSWLRSAVATRSRSLLTR